MKGIAGYFLYQPSFMLGFSWTGETLELFLGFVAVSIRW